MRRRAIATLALGALGAVGACYGPTPSPGAPCSRSGACPSELVCVRGTCETSPSSFDGRPLDAMLPPPDAGGIDEGWSEPVVVLAPGIAAHDPSVSTANGNVMYFRSDADGTDDIYFAIDEEIAKANTLNGSHAERSPEPGTGPLGADGLFFASNRDGTYDIYTSARFLTNTWTTPMKDSGLSSEDDDLDVAIAPDSMTAIVARGDGLCYRFTRSSPTGSWANGAAILSLPPDCEAPSLASDGSLYFHRPSLGLWVQHPGGAAGPLVELNETTLEQSPFISPDGKTIWFDRLGVIFQSTRP